jgi:hypothetical protein
MMNDEIEKKIKKKDWKTNYSQPGLTLSNSRHDRKQVEINYESQFSTNRILKHEIKNKSIKKGHRKQLESTRVNPSNL